MFNLVQKERIRYKIDGTTFLVNLSNCFTEGSKTFGGTLQDNKLKAWRRKRFSRFDFNITSMEGALASSNGVTELNITFKLFWNYRITIPSTIFFFAIFQYLMIRSDYFEWKYFVMVTSMELVAVIFYALLYRYQFKYDIEKYKKILNDVAGGSNVC